MKKLVLLFCIPVLASPLWAGVPEPKGAWEFNAPDYSAATAGAPLELVGSAEGIAGVDEADGAIRIGEGSYWVCTHGIAPNGGGTKVNQWTLLIDFSYPPSSLTDPPSGYNDLFQTDPTNADDSDWTINASGAVGIGAVGYTDAHGLKTQPDTWYRMVVVVENGVRYDVYFDGVEIFKGTPQAVDGRFSLAEALLLFCAGNKQDGDDAPINVSTVAIWGVPLSANNILTLGRAGESVFKETAAPEVNAGEDRSVELDETMTAVVNLEGMVIDDDEDVAVAWQMISGPNQVAIESADSPTATVTFTAPGQYTFELSADDGEYVTTDRVMISVWVHNYDGLLAYWDFEEAWNGVTVNDVSGNRNYGMIVDTNDGVSEYATGKVGQGLNLLSNGPTAAGDWVALDLVMPDRGTVALWAKPINFYNYHSVFDNSGNGNDWEMWIYSDSRARFRVESDTAVTANLNSLAPDGNGQDKWWHFAATWARDGAKVTTQLYVNGLLKEQVTGTWINPGATFFLGGGHVENNACNSTFDEVRIYDKVLSLPQVLGLVYPENQPPVAHAGVGQAVSLTETGAAVAILTGSVEDADGSPIGLITQLWQMVAGPNAVTIESPTAMETTVIFTAPGVYIFSLTASDGQSQSVDEVTVEVLPLGYTGLVVHLPLDGTVEDIAGGHTATLIDGAVGTHEYVEGIDGLALRLAGTQDNTDNDVVAIDYVYTDNGSVSLWFKPAMLYNYNSILDNSGDGNDWEMWIYGTGEFAGRIQSGYVRGYYMTVDTWYHIVMTWRRDTVNPNAVDQRLYINGAPAATNTSEWVDPGSTVFLGGGHSGNDDCNGDIDDFRIYDRPITLGEIQQLASR
ncbi:MAG TPA: PKD domain-containing protein [Sedimentisphaerales bacterium]|jgi:hypothetical protein|nr:PKD domain-containing protein [Sedimentisphaerales bacterium]HNU28333.1 PKD domain-containing protein [Sedimentisphaerales bacterium]